MSDSSYLSAHPGPPLASHLKDSLLLRQFREFWQEVTVRKESVLSGGGFTFSEELPGGRNREEASLKDAFSEKEDQPDSGAPLPPAQTGTLPDLQTSVPGSDFLHADLVRPIQNRLLAVLENQVPVSRRQGGEYGVSYYKEAQYVMAALADEVFLGLDWKGREAWNDNLLEFRLFGTYNAGDLFFEKTEKLLKDRDPAYGEIACVYFLALALGFRGKYKDKDDSGYLEFCRRQLFAFVFQKNPDIGAEGRKLFSAPYAYLITQGERAELPYLKGRIWIFSLVLLLFLVSSTVVWVYFTDDLFRSVDSLIMRFTEMAG
ncbi:MAG: DotU family type IV/VI secretion system protein [Desulfobacterales bacterium]